MPWVEHGVDGVARYRLTGHGAGAKLVAAFRAE
jgi:hypothetical protein